MGKWGDLQEQFQQNDLVVDELMLKTWKKQLLLTKEEAAAPVSLSTLTQKPSHLSTPNTHSFKNAKRAFRKGLMWRAQRHQGHLFSIWPLLRPPLGGGLFGFRQGNFLFDFSPSTLLFFVLLYSPFFDCWVGTCPFLSSYYSYPISLFFLFFSFLFSLKCTLPLNFMKQGYNFTIN